MMIIKALHLTGPALRFFETSRSLQPARQVKGVVRPKDLSWRRSFFVNYAERRMLDLVHAILRTCNYLSTVGDSDRLIAEILQEAVAVLDAQRASVVLASADSNALQLKALASGNRPVPSRPAFSERLAKQVYDRGESILVAAVKDDSVDRSDLQLADSLMASILCVLLRTPERRLGVLHLDRGSQQAAFAADELMIADAFASVLAVGMDRIEARSGI